MPKRHEFNRLLYRVKDSEIKLNSIVNELKRQEAVQINNSCLHRQLGYIVDCVGLKQAEELIDEGCNPDRIIQYSIEVLKNEKLLSRIIKLIILLKQQEADEIICTGINGQIQFLVTHFRDIKNLKEALKQVK